MTDEEITEEIRRRFIAKFGEKQFAEAMERRTQAISQLRFESNPDQDMLLETAKYLPSSFENTEMSER